MYRTEKSSESKCARPKLKHSLFPLPNSSILKKKIVYTNNYKISDKKELSFAEFLTIINVLSTFNNKVTGHNLGRS